MADTGEFIHHGTSTCHERFCNQGERTYMDMIFKVAIKRIFLRRYCCVYSYFFMGCVNILNILKGFLQMTNLFCMVHQLIHQMIERCKHAMIWFIP